MPLLSQHQSNDFTKMLVEGDPGSGKTGGLTSLVKADWWLGILDYDNGLESLKQFILRECPDKINNVEYRTLRDKHRASPDGPVIDGPAKAFVEGLKMLDRWKYKSSDGSEVDYGVPAEWGPNRILVIDSLTFMSKAAFDFREQQTIAATKGKYDQRAIYKDAQDGIEKMLGFIQSDNFRTNVIVLTHIKYVDNEDGTRKGYPTSIGSALAPTIPAYFNSVALCRTKAGGKRVIQTAATAMIDLKNPKPFAMLPEYPIETGMADFFAVLREPPQHASKDVRVPSADTRAARANEHASASRPTVRQSPRPLTRRA